MVLGIFSNPNDCDLEICAIPLPHRKATLIPWQLCPSAPRAKGGQKQGLLCEPWQCGRKHWEPVLIQKKGTALEFINGKII